MSHERLDCLLSLKTVHGNDQRPRDLLLCTKFLKVTKRKTKKSNGKIKLRLSRQIVFENARNNCQIICTCHDVVLKFVILIELLKKMQTWIPDIYVD